MSTDQGHAASDGAVVEAGDHIIPQSTERGTMLSLVGAAAGVRWVTRGKSGKVVVVGVVDGVAKTVGLDLKEG